MGCAKSKLALNPTRDSVKPLPPQKVEPLTEERKLDSVDSLTPEQRAQSDLTDRIMSVTAQIKCLEDQLTLRENDLRAATCSHDRNTAKRLMMERNRIQRDLDTKATMLSVLQQCSERLSQTLSTRMLVGTVGDAQKAINSILSEISEDKIAQLVETTAEQRQALQAAQAVLDAGNARNAELGLLPDDAQLDKELDELMQAAADGTLPENAFAHTKPDTATIAKQYLDQKFLEARTSHSPLQIARSESAGGSSARGAEQESLATVEHPVEENATERAPNASAARNTRNTRNAASKKSKVLA